MSELFGNRQKQSLVVFLFLLAGGLYVSMRNGNPDDPETIVKMALRELVAAAEKEDLDPFKKWISEKGKDSSGRNKDEIVKTLFGIFFRYKNISLTETDLTVEMGTNPDQITAYLSLFMGADSPLPSDRGDFSFVFRRESDGKWRIWEIDWEDGAQYSL